ncbi:hypothetical protein [Micromonospora peucetia]|uniref:Uncharacterized protein n=1 Tax=Micromonospora peucetia TaxID=47871 RepID=A0A1C6V3N1_9ACTN|nr:hypothetical protein [Micromonospora peucetia]WSA35310.1 hypothetical protein OIE14_15335 [Micromonospora peucetia]SCL60838.1 hypothetical protein GA0070608_2373 [Micromonospora peucetia]
MNVDVADRPESGPDAGEHATPVGADDRLRTAVLAMVGLAALVGGGWWWQAEAPRTGPVATVPSAAPEVGARLGAPPEARVRFVVPEGSGRPVSFWVDPSSGAAYRTDPNTGATVRTDVDVREPRRLLAGLLDERARTRRLDSYPDPVWTAQAVLSPPQGLVRHAAAEGGARHLLQYRCVGPGELLIVIDGARAADPITSACDGSVHSTEVVGRGGPFQVSLSSANAERLRVEAQLVAIP